MREIFKAVPIGNGGVLTLEVDTAERHPYIVRTLVSGMPNTARKLLSFDAALDVFCEERCRWDESSESISTRVWERNRDIKERG